jgi:hypothetical protein
MKSIKKFLKTLSEKISSKIALFFGIFLKKELTIKALSYIAFLSFAIVFFIIDPIISSINIWFIRFVISFLVICFYIRHIYLMWQFFPPKNKRSKHKRTILQIILLRNPKPIDKSDGIKIIIAFDLFAIAVFVGYFS